MKHHEEMSYSKPAPSPRTDSGPLTVHFFLFNLDLSLGRVHLKKKKKATSLIRNGTHSLLALFLGMVSCFYFSLREDRDLWESGALDKEKGSVKDDNGRVSRGMGFRHGCCSSITPAPELSEPLLLHMCVLA